MLFGDVEQSTVGYAPISGERAWMRGLAGDIFGVPENFFRTFPRRRKFYFDHVAMLIENANDLAFFSRLVEDYVANLKLSDWHFTPSYRRLS